MSTRVSFGRQVAVELRKLVDTRGSRWTLGTGAVVLLGTLASAIAADGSSTVPDVLAAAGLMVALVMGTIGVLAVTGESRFHTAVIYLPVSSGRSQLYFASYVAGMIAAFALQAFTLALVLLVAAVTPGLGFGDPGDWLGRWAFHRRWSAYRRPSRWAWPFFCAVSWRRWG